MRCFTLSQVTTSLLAIAIIASVLLSACTAKSEGLDRVKSAGILRVAIDPSFLPFEYLNDEGELVGYDIDLAQEIARLLEVDVQFVSTGYDALYDALTIQRADIIISALYPDPSRTKAFAFSTPYFNAGDMLIVGESTITNWESLGGKRIGCLFGTSGHMTVLGWQKALSPPPVIITTNSPVTFTEALKTGELDAVLLDHVSAIEITGVRSDTKILPEMITHEPYVVASRIENGALIEAIDAILAELNDDGTLQWLSEKWMHSEQ